MVVGLGIRAALLVAGAGCVALIASPHGAGAAPHGSCSVPKSRTILATKRVRVLSVPTRYGVSLVRACWRPTGRSVPTGNNRYVCVDEGCGGVRRFRLAGRMLAYEDSGADKNLGSSYEVVIVDVRRRRTIRRVPTGSLTPSQARPPEYPGEQYVGIGSVTALVLRANGAVAWIADNYHVHGAGPYEVRKLDGPHSVLLASGTDVAPRSLRPADHRISWVQAGQRRSARLG